MSEHTELTDTSHDRMKSIMNSIELFNKQTLFITELSPNESLTSISLHDTSNRVAAINAHTQSHHSTLKQSIQWNGFNKQQYQQKHETHTTEPHAVSHAPTDASTSLQPCRSVQLIDSSAQHQPITRTIETQTDLTDSILVESSQPTTNRNILNDFYLSRRDCDLYNTDRRYQLVQNETAALIQLLETAGYDINY